MTNPNTYTLVRKVLIRETELKKLKRQAVVKSDYGHKNLYDSIEWKPITSNDILMNMLKGDLTPGDNDFKYFFVRYYCRQFYDARYTNWDFRLNPYTKVIEISADRGYWQPFGWAVLKKELPKVNDKRDTQYTVR